MNHARVVTLLLHLTFGSVPAFRVSRPWVWKIPFFTPSRISVWERADEGADTIQHRGPVGLPRFPQINRALRQDLINEIRRAACDRPQCSTAATAPIR